MQHPHQESHVSASSQRFPSPPGLVLRDCVPWRETNRVVRSKCAFFYSVFKGLRVRTLAKGKCLVHFPFAGVRRFR
jgi:hypothetical protein